MDFAQLFQQLADSQGSRVDLSVFFVDLVLTYIFLTLLGRIYDRCGVSLSNRQEFARNLVIVGMTTMIIITVVKSSLALSLGLVGALSIVRFRTPIKEPEELTYIFLSIAVGLGLGASQRGLVSIGFVTVAVVIWMHARRRSTADHQTMYLGVSAPEPGAGLLDKVVNVLQDNAKEIRLKRVDESPDSFDADFSIVIDEYTNLEKLTTSLRAIDSRLQTSFVDPRGR